MTCTCSIHECQHEAETLTDQIDHRRTLYMTMAIQSKYNYPILDHNGLYRQYFVFLGLAQVGKRQILLSSTCSTMGLSIHFSVFGGLTTHPQFNPGNKKLVTVVQGRSVTQFLRKGQTFK